PPQHRPPGDGADRTRGPRGAARRAARRAGPVHRGAGPARVGTRHGRAGVNGWLDGHRSRRRELMGLFSRRRKGDEAAPAETDAPTEDATTEDASADDAAAAPSGRGPWDVADVPELGQRLDLGALRVPARPGLKLR